MSSLCALVTLESFAYWMTDYRKSTAKKPTKNFAAYLSRRYSSLSWRAKRLRWNMHEHFRRGTGLGLAPKPEQGASPSDKLIQSQARPGASSTIYFIAYCF